MKTTLKTGGLKSAWVSLSVLAAGLAAAPAFAADFGTLDANADGQVSFDEYRTVALTEGKTSTLAAQEFTRMAQGDAVLTADEFALASAFVDQPYALQTIGEISDVAFEAPLSTSIDVESANEPVEVFEAYPADPSVMDAPAVEPPMTDMPETEIETDIETDVETELTPVEPMTTETPLEIDPVVGGAVESTETDGFDITLEDAPTDAKTPMEEGTDTLDLEAPVLDETVMEQNPETDVQMGEKQMDDDADDGT